MVWAGFGGDAMSRIKKILFATDFSPHSRKALGYAAEMSARLEIPLAILHVVQLPTYPIPDGVILRGPEVLSEMVNRARRAIDDEKRIAADLGAASVETLWVEGPAAPEI